MGLGTHLRDVPVRSPHCPGPSFKLIASRARQKRSWAKQIASETGIGDFVKYDVLVLWLLISFASPLPALVPGCAVFPVACIRDAALGSV